jgi:hypothetical protein
MRSFNESAHLIDAQIPEEYVRITYGTTGSEWSVSVHSLDQREWDVATCATDTEVPALVKRVRAIINARQITRIGAAEAELISNELLRTF